MKKIRLDRLLTKRCLASSEKEAQSLIMAGCVLVDEVPITSSGTAVHEAAVLRIRQRKSAYVSRGGIKLAHALQAFQCDVTGKCCLDIGASTGGFTDCLLQQGARRVYAVDVGYGKLDSRLQRDPRVVILDRTNIRHLTPNEFSAPLQVVTIDVSFISAASILPTVDSLVGKGTWVFVLVKPQFEVKKEEVGRGGIVRDAGLHQWAMDHVLEAGEKLGWSVHGKTPSPITGAKGNKEFFLYFIC